MPCGTQAHEASRDLSWQPSRYKTNSSPLTHELPLIPSVYQYRYQCLSGLASPRDALSFHCFSLSMPTPALRGTRLSNS